MKAFMTTFVLVLYFTDLVLTLQHCGIHKTFNGFCAAIHSLLDVGYFASTITLDVTSILSSILALTLLDKIKDNGNILHVRIDLGFIIHLLCSVTKKCYLLHVILFIN